MNKIKKAGKVDLEPVKSKKSKITKAKKSTYKPKIKSGHIKGTKKAKIKQISIKYKEQNRYIKLVSKKQLEKHIIDGNFVFSKSMTKQYNTLNKRFGLSQLEYLNLYYGIRKANAKGARLGKIDSLYHVKYSTKFKRMHDRADFERYMASIKNVLRRDYKERKNKLFKERFINNIKLILEDKPAEEVIKLVKEMDALQLKQFLDENPDLEKVMYESKSENFTSFDKEATSLIENRLLNFLGKEPVDIKTKYDVKDAEDLIK